MGPGGPLKAKNCSNTTYNMITIHKKRKMIIKLSIKNDFFIYARKKIRAGGHHLGTKARQDFLREIFTRAKGLTFPFLARGDEGT